MPKIKSGKNSTPELIGERVNLRSWLDETEKDKDGNDVRKNVPESVYALIKDGTETKDDKGKVIKIVSDAYTLTVETAKRRIPATKDGKPYEMEYANLLPNTAEAALPLVDNNLDVTIVKTDKGEDDEKPSVIKYFRQGYGMLARNNASARIAAKVEGPEKALEQAVKALIKAKGWSEEKARAKAKLMMSDD